MKYFYKYIKVHALQSGGFTAFYRDEFNSFIFCDKYGNPTKTESKAEAINKARQIVDELNGKKEV